MSFYDYGIPAASPRFRGASVQRTSNLTLDSGVSKVMSYHKAEYDTDTMWAANKLDPGTSYDSLRIPETALWLTNFRTTFRQPNQFNPFVDVMLIQEASDNYGGLGNAGRITTNRGFLARRKKRSNTDTSSQHTMSLLSIDPLMAGDKIYARVAQTNDGPNPADIETLYTGGTVFGPTKLASYALMPTDRSIACYLRSLASQVVTTGTWTKVTLGAVDFINGMTYELSKNSVPLRHKGVYIIIGRATFAINNGVTGRGLRIVKTDASGKTQIPACTLGPSFNSDHDLQVVGIVKGFQGDDISLEVFHDFGANITLEQSETFRTSNLRIVFVGDYDTCPSEDFSMPFAQVWSSVNQSPSFNSSADAWPLVYDKIEAQNGPIGIDMDRPIGGAQADGRSTGHFRIIKRGLYIMVANQKYTATTTSKSVQNLMFCRNADRNSVASFGGGWDPAEWRNGRNGGDGGTHIGNGGTGYGYLNAALADECFPGDVISVMDASSQAPETMLAATREEQAMSGVTIVGLTPAMYAGQRF